jgi:hypothetical protein
MHIDLKQTFSPNNPLNLQIIFRHEWLLIFHNQAIRGYSCLLMMSYE